MLQDFKIITMYDKLKKLLDGDNNQCDENLWIEMKTNSKLLTLKKKEVLVSIGSTKKYVYFVAEGSLVTSTVSTEGENKTVWFHLDDLFYMATCTDSYFDGTPTKFELKALEKSTVIRFSKESFDAWILKYPSFNRFYIEGITKDSLLMQELRTLKLISSTKEFIAILQDKHPSLVKRVSSKNMAHFLGISPEWYSKLKNQK